MKVKLNPVVAKRNLLKDLELATKKADAVRWANSPEGIEYLIAEKTKKELAELKAQFAIGQLVWRDDILDNATDITPGTPVSRCGKIIEIDDDCVHVEMLYVVILGEKYDGYADWMSGAENKKGDVYNHSLYHLEKHISKKNGNVWWKVK